MLEGQWDESFDRERLPLLAPSSPQWVETVLSNLDAFLIDHAACERKVSALCMSFVVKYRDKSDLVEQMIAVAQEELEHFQEVVALLHRRGLAQGPDEKNDYVNSLLGLCRNSSDERLLDRLLVSGIIEARGCERFGILGQALGPETELGAFYTRLSRAEAKHQLFFVQLAAKYFDRDVVSERLAELLEQEAKILAAQPFRPALH